MHTVEQLYFLSYAQSAADKRDNAGNTLTSIFKNAKTWNVCNTNDCNEYMPICLQNKLTSCEWTTVFLEPCLSTCHLSSVMWYCITGWVVSNILQEIVTSILNGSRSLLTYSFKISPTTYPAMQHHIPDDDNSWKHHCKYPKSCRSNTVWQNLEQLYPDDGGSMFLHSAGIHLEDYTLSWCRRPKHDVIQTHI